MKRLMIVLAVVVVSIFGFNSFAFAATPTPVATNGLSKDIIDKANKGDLDAQAAIRNYDLAVLERAKNGDPEAIEILKNLICFDEQKVSAMLPKNGLKLKPGETATFYFDDGSAVSFSGQVSVKNKNRVSSAAYYHKDKTWWFGVSMASIRTWIDNTGSTRYIAHIDSTWAEPTSTACTMSETTSVVLKNDVSVVFGIIKV